jgi:hypothetical protein
VQRTAAFQCSFLHMDPFPHMRIHNACTDFRASGQGCQMVYFETKNPTFGYIWNGKCLYTLRPFGMRDGLLV